MFQILNRWCADEHLTVKDLVKEVIVWRLKGYLAVEAGQRISEIVNLSPHYRLALKVGRFQEVTKFYVKYPETINLKKVGNANFVITICTNFVI